MQAALSSDISEEKLFQKSLPLSRRQKYRFFPITLRFKFHATYDHVFVRKRADDADVHKIGLIIGPHVRESTQSAALD